MENKTINEVIEDANSIDISQPTSNEYLPCNLWRMNCVKRAIMLFCVKLTQWGYNAYYSDTYFFAEKDGRCMYCQYSILLHTYRINSINGESIKRNRIMEIELTKEDFDIIFEKFGYGRKIGYYRYRIIEK